jgi:integrase
LGTDNKREANHRAKLALAELDQILNEARALANLPGPTCRDSLNAAEIARMSEAFFVKMLADDEAYRFGGRAHMAQLVDWMRRNENASFEPPYALKSLPEFGWTAEQLAFQKGREAEELETMREALARGDITAVVDDVLLLLSDFNISLDRNSASYRQLGVAVLRAYVRGLEAIAKRSAGEVIETPKALLAPAAPASVTSGSLREALEGWKKERDRPADGVHEYTRAVEMFIELHGNIAIADIKRSHASQFREALRQVPKTRKGPLLKAGLPELRQWGQEHPSAPKVSASTVNKQLGAVQAIISWGFRNSLVPDEVPWADPFKNARLGGEQSTRDAFDPRGLQTIFDAPLFTHQQIPEGGKGSAAVWLPLLAVFMGGRQGEFAALRVSDIRTDTEMNIPLLWIVRDASAGKRVKSDAGERVVPVHPQLIQLGFLEYVEARRTEYGDKAWLFPAVAPD